jgi:nicotinamidase-related amidase
MLIDMQRDFVGGLRRGEAERIIPNQIKVLRYAQQHGIPIIVFEFKSHEYGTTVPQIKSALKKNYVIMEKYSDDAFHLTSLYDDLVQMRTKKIFIMGINACYCVYETARSAKCNGFEIATSNDVISGLPYHPRDNNMPWYRRNGLILDSINQFELSKVVF